MAEFVNLISDISMTVKLGWLAVLVWGAAQFVWYERGRVPSDVSVCPAHWLRRTARWVTTTHRAS